MNKSSNSITVVEIKELIKATVINSLCYSAGFLISFFEKKEKENKNEF